MSRIRLLMSVEGQTEQAFVGAAIAPHLVLTAVENGGAGRSKMVALGGVDLS